MVTVKQIENFMDYGRCVSISNPLIEAIVTVDIGPRIVKFAFKDGENVMNTDRKGLGYKTDEEYTAFFGEGRRWESFGGHRVWISPESYPETYTPDDKEVSCKITENGAIFTSQEDTEVKTLKVIELEMNPDTADMKVIMRVKNTDTKPKEFSVWALSVCSANGALIVPLNTDDTGLLHNRSFSVWPYTNMRDDRIFWGNKYVTLIQKTDAETPIKIGFNSKKGVGHYILGNTVFTKKYNSTHGTANYPDDNCSFETYTNDVILEFETLNELKNVNPGEESIHTEYWSLSKKPCEVDLKDESSIEAFVSKL